MLSRMAARSDSSWMAAFSALSRSFCSKRALAFFSRRTASVACFFTRAVRAHTTQEMVTMDSMATG
jgi:hypothetical protein